MDRSKRRTKRVGKRPVTEDEVSQCQLYERKTTGLDNSQQQHERRGITRLDGTANTQNNSSLSWKVP